MDANTGNEVEKRVHFLSRAWSALLLWLSYVTVDIFEAQSLDAHPCNGGIFISGSALIGMRGVRVDMIHFDALTRQIARHKPGVPFPLRQGNAWAIIPARYFRLFQRKVCEVTVAWHSV